MDKTSGREADLCRSMRILALSYIDCRVSYHKTLCLQGHHIRVLSFFLNVIVIFFFSSTASIDVKQGYNPRIHRGVK